MYGKKLYASCKLSKVYGNSLMLTSIYRACWMGEDRELRRSITNENKIIHKFKDKS